MINKIIIATISSMMTIIIVTLMMANPVIALAVNQMISPPEFDPNQDYTDKECAEMFPIYREGYYDCTGGIGFYLIQVLN
jgi:hypothetical protein